MKKFFRAILVVFLISLISSTAVNLIKEKESMGNIVKEDITNDFGSILLLVNREHNLPKDYKPSDLVIPDVRFADKVPREEMMMRKEASKALEGLIRKAETQKISLYGVSGYRSYSTQSQTYSDRVKLSGKNAADKYVAYPGQSEHQAGLAMDITGATSVKSPQAVDFGQTKEGIWLKNNAYNFGFIIRYPKGKEHITGYSYEPWHTRYVGVKAAGEIQAKGITLEEYLR